MAFLNAIQIPWNVQIITFNRLKMFVVELRLSNGLNWEVSSSVRTSHSWNKFQMNTNVEMHAGIWHETPTSKQTV
jgi:hypothetical protein